MSIKYEPWAALDKEVGQAYVHASPARFRVAMAGRQSGKSLTGIAEICVDAMSHGGHIDWWIAPNYRVKDRAWRGLLDFLPAEVVAKKNETELRIRLTNGSEIFVKSADAPDSLVSESLDFAVCDEAGQWKETAWTMGVRPMFTARPGSRAVLLGTPRGRNWFHRLWLLGRGGDPDYASFHWKSEDSPFSDPKDLAEARKNLPRDIYAQEYDADPLDSTGGVFRAIRSRVMPNAKPDQFTVIGVDLARKGDFTAIIPMNSQRQGLYVERSQDDWPIQKQRLAFLAFQHGFARLTVDEASVGDVIVQDLRAAGLQVEAVNTSSTTVKRSVIDNLRLAFENGTVSIPDDEVLIGELEAYSYEVLPSGQIRYSAPEGSHDDTVIALALAVWGQRGAMFVSSQNRRSYMGRSRGESYLGRTA